MPSSWYLDKVITYTGQMVTYTYTDDYIWYPGYMDQQVIETSNFKWALVYNDSTNYPGSMTATDSMVQLEEFIHRIKQINYPNGDIVAFDTDGNMRSDVGGDSYEPNNKAITGVTVYKGYDATVNNSFTYKFNYGYFNSTTPDSTRYPTGTSGIPMYTLRLKLQSISKTGTDGTTMENYYTFGYVGDNAGEYHLPERLSGENDCYGYFNYPGNPFTSSILPTSEESAYNSLLTTLGKLSIPPHTFSFTNSGGTNISITYGRDQTPNWAYAAAGTLETVTNGTGGNVKFYYQSHNLSNPPDFNSTPVNTGYYDDNNMYSFKSSYGPNPNLLYTTANDGVCIDSIVTSDGFNPDNNTKTIYTFNGGMRFFVGGFFWYPTITNQLFLHYHSTPGMPGVSATPGDDQTVVLGKLYQNTFVNPIEYVNGFNHGYSNAVVQTYGYNNTLLKTEKYGFTNIMTQSGEGTYAGSTTTVTPLPVGSCRIRFPYFGMYGQTFMPECFEQQYLGLLKTDTVLDNTGDILSITANTYAENRSSDSLTGLEQRFYFGVGSFSSGVADSIYAWFRTGAYIEAGAEADTAYNRPSSVVDLVSSTTTNYSGTTSLPVASVYVYDANDNLVETGYNDSKGHREGEVNSYTTNTYSMTYGASGPGGSGGTLTHTVQNLTWKYKEVSYDGTNWNLQSSSALNGYFDNTHSTSGYGITVTGMLRCNSVVNMFANYVVSLGTSPPSLSGSYMIKAKDFLVYDDHNNVVETAYNNDEDTSSAIWDNRIGEKVAQVNNAAYNDIAYTSFEGGISFLTGFDYNKGNWTFSPGQIIAGSTITGRYYYDLDGYPVTSLNTLTSGKQYILSFWYNNTYAVPNFSIPGTINDSSTNRLTAGSWTLATIRFTATSAGYVSVSTTTSGVRIDELRLMPASASMDTYTYEPLLGVSSHCDERNNITYYEYDAMGRLHVVKDINGNVISMTRNVVQGSDGY